MKGLIHTNVSLTREVNLEDALEKTKDLLSMLVVEKALPGLVVGVSVDGKTVATFSKSSHERLQMDLKCYF